MSEVLDKEHEVLWRLRSIHWIVSISLVLNQLAILGLLILVATNG